MQDVEILDTTLRDGSYSVGFQLTLEDACRLGGLLARAGVPFIEVGHGWGVDARGQLPFEPEPNEDLLPPYDEAAYFKAVRHALPGAKLGAVLFVTSPGVDLHSLRLLTDAGVDFVRMAAHAEEIRGEKIRRLVRAARDAQMTVSVNLLKTYAYSLEAVADAAAAAEDLGADWIYVVDSAGGMRPADVARYVEAVRSRSRARVGFHGHNNLGVAVANCLAAIDGGATLVDSSLQGLGRAMGNPATEQLLAWLQLDRGLCRAIDRRLVFRAGRALVRTLVEPGFDPTHVLSGFAQLHSDWLGGIARVAEAQGIELDELLEPLGQAARTAGTLARVSEAFVQQVCAQLEPRPAPAPSAHAGHWPPLPVCESVDDAIGALRVARARDRHRVILALVPAGLHPIGGPLIESWREWTVAWVPVTEAPAARPLPAWIDHVVVAGELAGEGPARAARVSMRALIAESVAIWCARGAPLVACDDDALLRTIDARLPPPRPGLPGGDAPLALIEGTKGADALGRWSEGEASPRVVMVVGPVAPLLPALRRLEARGVRAAVPDVCPLLVAHCETVARSLGAAGASPGGSRTLQVDESVGALIGRTPFAYASRLGATAPSPVDLAIQDLAIVSLEREHVPALLVLGGEVFPYERESFAGSIDRYLEDCDGRATAPDRSAFWVLAASDGLAGFVGIYELPELPDEAWLGWYGVSAAHRHKGWGRRLLRFAIGAARARGFHTLRLWTTDEPDCAASARLFDREGFDCVEVGASPRGDRLLVRTLGLTGAPPIPWEALEPKPRNLGAVTLP